MPERIPILDKEHALETFQSIPDAYTVRVPAGRSTAPINFDSTRMGTIADSYFGAGTTLGELRAVVDPGVDKNLYGVVRVRSTGIAASRLVLATMVYPETPPTPAQTVATLKGNLRLTGGLAFRQEDGGLRFENASSDPDSVVTITAVPANGELARLHIPGEQWFPADMIRDPTGI